MRTKNRAQLEKDLREAETTLRSARAQAEKAQDGFATYHSTLSGDMTLAKLGADEKLNGWLAAKNEAQDRVAEATKRRDEIMAELAQNPISATINGHHGGAEGADRKGLGLGFTLADLDHARASLLGSNPVPVRLGPAPILDPRRAQAEVDPAGFYAAGGGTGDFPQALVGQYDLAPFPYLRERPSVAGLFPAETIDRYSEYVYKFNTPADQAAPVSEGGTKPTSSPQTEQIEIIPQTVAHIGVFKRQTMFNFPDFVNVLSSEFVAGLLLAVDVQLLSGDQAAPNLNGILHESGVGTYVRDTTNETRLDAILSAITNVRVNAFAEPTTLIIHPNDVEAARKEKASTAGLYLANPMGSLEGGLPNQIWGLNVVATTSISEGTAVVIEPTLYGHLTIRQPVAVEINPFEGWSTNELGIRCEAWLNIGCVHPQAACVLTL